MSSSDVKTTVNRGLAWVAMASSMVWVLDIIGMIVILALWIPPEQMGIAALAIPFFPALDLFSEMGLPSAVIQRDDHTPEKISTLFWMNFAMSLVLLAVLSLVVGPTLAAIHGHEILAAMFTAYGFKLVWHNVYVMPRALMRKALRFKEESVVRTLGNVAEFGAKIGFAAGGAGIWVFVLGPAARVVVVGIGIQICNPWWPRMTLRLRESIEYARFGLKASASQIVYHVYTNLDYQVIGYLYTPEATGLYWFAYELVLKPCFLIGQTLQSIAFAAYSRLKHERDQLVEQFISFTRISLVVMIGFLAVVMVSAEDILYLIWGAKAAPAAAAARVLCGVGVLRALGFVIPPLLNGLGRPGLSLMYNCFAAVLMPAAFVLSAVWFGDEYGYLAVAYSWVIAYPIAFGVLLYLALGLIELPAVEYARRVLGIPISGAVAIAMSLGVQRAAASLDAGLRFGLATASTLVVFSLLLAYWQGISPRAISQAIRGKKQTAPAGSGNEG